MTVNNYSAAAVIRRPIQTDRQPVFVALTRCLAVKAEIAHTHRASADILLLYSGVSYNELAVVEDVMTYKRVDKTGSLLFEVLSRSFKLGNGYVEAVGHRDILSPEIFQQLDIMVARNGYGAARLYHVHYKAENLCILRPSVA